MPESIDTIGELFARDPFELLDKDVESIIEYFQGVRAQFKLSGKGGPRVEKPKTSLDDLGL